MAACPAARALIVGDQIVGRARRGRDQLALGEVEGVIAGAAGDRVGADAAGDGVPPAVARKHVVARGAVEAVAG